MRKTSPSTPTSILPPQRRGGKSLIYLIYPFLFEEGRPGWGWTAATSENTRQSVTREPAP
jgi:hypothetical protein